jgi:hypothetical protein
VHEGHASGNTELLSEAQIANVATVLPDGSPHVTPVWIDTDGEAVLFNAPKGNVKHRTYPWRKPDSQRLIARVVLE